MFFKITGCDYPEDNEIEVSYIIASFIHNTELILKLDYLVVMKTIFHRLLLFALFGKLQTFKKENATT